MENLRGSGEGDGEEISSPHFGAPKEKESNLSNLSNDSVREEGSVSNSSEGNNSEEIPITASHRKVIRRKKNDAISCGSAFGSRISTASDHDHNELAELKKLVAILRDENAQLKTSEEQLKMKYKSVKDLFVLPENSDHEESSPSPTRPDSLNSYVVSNDSQLPSNDTGIGCAPSMFDVFFIIGSSVDITLQPKTDIFFKWPQNMTILPTVQTLCFLSSNTLFLPDKQLKLFVNGEINFTSHIFQVKKDDSSTYGIVCKLFQPIKNNVQQERAFVLISRHPFIKMHLQFLECFIKYQLEVYGYYHPHFVLNPRNGLDLFCQYITTVDDSGLKLLDQYYNLKLPNPGDEISIEFGNNLIEYKLPDGKLDLSLSASLIIDFGDLLFNFLSLDNLLFIIASILIEDQIIFYSKYVQPLSYIVAIIINFIFPLKYCFHLIPILDKSLYYLLESPTPYIIGILDDVDTALADNKSNRFLVSVDLDNDKINLRFDDYLSHKFPFFDTLFYTLSPLVQSLKEANFEKMKRSLLSRIFNHMTSYIYNLFLTCYDFYKHPDLKNQVIESEYRAALGNVSPSNVDFILRFLETQLFNYQLQTTDLDYDNLSRKKSRTWSEEVTSLKM